MTASSDLARWRGVRILALEADKAALVEVLKPFADEAGNYDYGDGSGPDIADAPNHSGLREVTDLLVGDLRKARATLAKHGGGK